MHQRSGPAPARTDASPVEKPSRTVRNHQSYPDCTRTHKPRNPLFRGTIFALAFEIVAVAVIVGGWYAVGFLANHLPNLMLGVCIVLLGVLFGAMLAARS